MVDRSTLVLIVDTSGSMSEGGKCFIARGAVRTVEQYVRLGYGSAHLTLVAWSEGARTVEWNPVEEYPSEMLTCEGAADAQALVDHLDQIGLDLESRVLLITDGFWSRADEKVLKFWVKRFQAEAIRIVKIGADANPLLKGAGVIAIDELFATLSGWLEGRDA